MKAGIKCNAPYMGKIHLETVIKRSKGTERQEVTEGWTAQQGTYRGRQADPSAGDFPRNVSRKERRSVLLDGVVSWIPFEKRNGELWERGITYGRAHQIVYVLHVENAMTNEVAVDADTFFWNLGRLSKPSGRFNVFFFRKKKYQIESDWPNKIAFGEGISS